MKKIFILLSLFTTIQISSAQNNVGIGTNTPDPSAKLDINTSADAANDKKGLLIPRVSLTATNVAAPVNAPATSLLVYNTNTAGTVPNNVTPGYYYWEGLKWVKIIALTNNTLDLGYIVG